MHKKNKPKYIREKNGDLIISFYVKINNKRNEFRSDKDQNELAVFITASPTKGRANKALIKAFSDFTEIAQSSIKLISGHKLRDKRIRIYDCDEKKRTRIISKFLSI
ncbi:MAG: DUF167 domain-containing protein [Promethearchaeota archaeon]